MEIVKPDDLILDVERIMRQWKDGKITDSEALFALYTILIDSGYDI